MKRVLVIVIIILLFLGILTAIIFKAVHPTPTTAPQQTTQTPLAFPTQSTIIPQSSSTVTENCYKWYIQANKENLQKNAPDEFQKGLQACFTTNFIAQWQAFIDNSGVNPVLLAQDYGDSWITTQSTNVSNQTADQATILLTLGTGNEAHRLIVQLVKTSDGWKIDGVSAASS